MASIDLPRAIQDYFAFAETTATRNGRRFSITLPYVRPDGRLDKLQWWYHLPPAKEKALGEKAADTLRLEATERFKVHIERWLQNTAHVMYGDGAIPQVSPEDQPRQGVQPMVTQPAPDDAECADVIQSGLPSREAEKTAFG